MAWCRQSQHKGVPNMGEMPAAAGYRVQEAQPEAWGKTSSSLCLAGVPQSLQHPSPVSPHQVGQRLLSFTTPEANISRKRSQRTSQKVMPSWARHAVDRHFSRCRGATSTPRNPASSRRLSLWGTLLSPTATLGCRPLGGAEGLASLPPLLEGDPTPHILGLEQAKAQVQLGQDSSHSMEPPRQPPRLQCTGRAEEGLTYHWK